MYTNENLIFFLTIPSIFPPSTKTYLFLADKGFAPPPLTSMSPKNVSFLDGSPNSNKNSIKSKQELFTLMNLNGIWRLGVAMYILVHSKFQDFFQNHPWTFFSKGIYLFSDLNYESGPGVSESPMISGQAEEEGEGENISAKDSTMFLLFRPVPATWLRPKRENIKNYIKVCFYYNLRLIFITVLIRN